MRSQQWDAISANAVTVLEDVDDFQVYLCNPHGLQRRRLQLEQRAVDAGRAGEPAASRRASAAGRSAAQAASASC